jgi:hypothetical protein
MLLARKEKRSKETSPLNIEHYGLISQIHVLKQVLGIHPVPRLHRGTRTKVRSFRSERRAVADLQKALPFEERGKEEYEHEQSSKNISKTKG